MAKGLNQGPSPTFSSRMLHRDTVPTSAAGAEVTVTSLAPLSAQQSQSVGQVVSSVSTQPGYQNVAVSGTALTAATGNPPTYPAKGAMNHPPSAALAAAEIAIQQANIMAQNRHAMRPTGAMLPTTQMPGGGTGQMVGAQPNASTLPLPTQQVKPNQPPGMLPTDVVMNNPTGRPQPSSSLAASFPTSIAGGQPSMGTTQLPHGSVANPSAAQANPPKFTGPSALPGAQPNMSVGQQLMPGQQQQPQPGGQQPLNAQQVLSGSQPSLPIQQGAGGAQQTHPVQQPGLGAQQAMSGAQQPYGVQQTMPGTQQPGLGGAHQGMAGGQQQHMTQHGMTGVQQHGSLPQHGTQPGAPSGQQALPGQQPMAAAQSMMPAGQQPMASGQPPPSMHPAQPGGYEAPLQQHVITYMLAFCWHVGIVVHV